MHIVRQLCWQLAELSELSSPDSWLLRSFSSPVPAGFVPNGAVRRGGRIAASTMQKYSWCASVTWNLAFFFHR